MGAEQSTVGGLCIRKVKSRDEGERGEQSSKIEGMQGTRVLVHRERQGPIACEGFLGFTDRPLNPRSGQVASRLDSQVKWLSSLKYSAHCIATGFKLGLGGGPDESC